MIAIDDLSFAYPLPRRIREFVMNPFAPRQFAPALRGVSLRIDAGERVAVVGRNGAGKTTLLKLVGGLLYPNAGRVSVFGFDTVQDNREVRSLVGYVINEERSFYWRLTGRQNLDFFAALNDLYGSEARHRVATLLERVGLSGAADRRVSDYSSGMRQRLALARGLLADPKILLLDEPTKSLDPIGADVIRDLILSATQEAPDRALIVTTNQFDDVISLCDRICVVRDHAIAADHPVVPETGNIRALVHGVLTRADRLPNTAQASGVH